MQTLPPNRAVYAMSGVERSGVARTAAHSAKVFLSINGVQRAFNRPDDTSRVMIESLKVVERPDATPSTASVTVMGFPVSTDDEVIIKLGSINNPDRVFAGTVLATTQGMVAKPAYPSYDLRLIDYTWQLNRIKVIGRFSGSLTTIVTGWMATYAPEWSVVNVEAGLPSIDEITFVEPVDLTVALTRLAARVSGVRWRGNYHKQLYFRRTALITVTQPQNLTVSNPLFMLNGFGPVERDTSQVVTRVHMEGGGSEALTDVAVGESIIPLRAAPATWYGDTGGSVVSGPQRFDYIFRFEGGGGSLVGPGASPANAPVLALAAGSGVDTGVHDVAVVYVTAAGKSLPGPVASMTVGTVPAPATAPSVGVPQSGAGPDPGVHRYAITEVTAAGETTPSPVSVDVTTTVVDPPNAAWTIGAGTGPAGGAWAIGDTLYIKAVYLTAAGATTPGPQSASWVATAQPFNPTLALSLNVFAQASSDPATTGIRVYVNKNGSWIGYYATLANITSVYDVSTTFTAGSPPVTNTALKAVIPLTDLAPASSLGTSRNLYGTAAGGSQLKLVAALDTTTATYNVTLADSGLGANAPTVNTAAAGQITTSAPIGPSSVTAREFYMSLTAGGARKLALTISDNTTVTGTITASNATLTAAAAEPSSDTSGLAQPAGQVLAGSTSIPVAGGIGGPTGFKTNDSGGYAVVGNGEIVIRYGGTSGNTLTDIPATGPGSLGVSINYGSQITAAPALYAISLSGGHGFILDSLDYAVKKGDPVNLWVTVNNPDAQAARQARLDPTNLTGGKAGIVEDVLQDRRLSRTEALARAQARLTKRVQPIVGLHYQTYDKNTHPTATVIADIAAPTNVHETLAVQEVTLSFQEANPPIFPLRDVQASAEIFTFEQVVDT